MQFVSTRTGEGLDFTKKGILYLLEHEICANICTNLIEKLANLTNAFKSNSLSKHSILHYMSYLGEIEVIRFLLKVKPSVDFGVLDGDGISPAFMALVNGHTDIVQLLVTHGFKPVGPKQVVVRLFHE